VTVINNIKRPVLLNLSMKISRPEGFKVNEIPGEYGLGEHTHFTLWKKGWTTLDAIKAIAKILGVTSDRFGYAGLKDKNAITTQRISAWRVPKARLEKLEIKNIRISKIKQGLEKIRIGTHKGNKFVIRLEGISLKQLKKPRRVPNLFGPQRFGGTELLGKKMLERDWKGLVRLLREHVVKNYLRKRPGDYLGAIKRVDKKLRVFWVNAWQAWQWNKNLDTSKKTQDLISYQPIPEMPELGRFPGPGRKTIMQVKNYKTSTYKDGVTLEFTLATGCYATVLIDFLTKGKILKRV
jgi:tRNA(Glu) U13 pseudouridine synthase TruD